MKSLSISTRLWIPVIVLMAMTVVMTSLAVVRTRHSQAESIAAQERQQAKLEASLRLLVAGQVQADARVAEERRTLEGLLDTPAEKSALAAATDVAGMTALFKLNEAQATELRNDVGRQRMRTVFLVAGVMATIVIVLGLSTLSMVRVVVQPLRQIVGLADRIAEGNLAVRLQSGRQDEIGDVERALGRMAESLRALVAEVRHSADSISTASTEIATGNQDLSQRTEQTASNLQQAASSVVELTGNVRQSADSAALANNLASEAAQVAGRSGEMVDRVISTMDEISASSRRIGDIIGVIDGIAFQTNILALNAAVEAARAGEQGRGFAVVAGEVRTLASRSAEAAREIKQLIAASVERVESGSRLVTEAGGTIRELVGAVQQVSGVVGEISAAASEQSQGIAQVNEAVNQLDQMTQQNAALVEQSAAAAEALREQTQRLNGMVATFRVEAAA